MSFRDQTYLVILNWLCSIDLVSHLCVAVCVSRSFNFRPLGEKKNSLSDFPVSIFLSRIAVPNVSRVSTAGCQFAPSSPPLPSHQPPATCSRSTSQLKHRQNGYWRHQPSSGRRDGEEEWERGRGFAVWYSWGVLLGHPNGSISCDINDLSLDNRLCSLSLPINEVTVVKSCVVTVMKKVLFPQSWHQEMRGGPGSLTGRNHPWEKQLPRNAL